MSTAMFNHIWACLPATMVAERASTVIGRGPNNTK
jgi:hypothetical protein